VNEIRKTPNLLVILSEQPFTKCVECQEELGEDMDYTLAPIPVKDAQGVVDLSKVGFIPLCYDCMDLYYENGGYWNEVAEAEED
jgi:hypothetical protein